MKKMDKGNGKGKGPYKRWSPTRSGAKDNIEYLYSNLAWHKTFCLEEEGLLLYEGKQLKSIYENKLDASRKEKRQNRMRKKRSSTPKVPGPVPSLTPQTPFFIQTQT